jgi:predicted ArsR family transcriptional regulator
MAEAKRDGDAWMLVEHHCPVCEAARACTGLCRTELDLFRATLGPDVEVERTQHLLSGDARCAYRVTERAPQEQR